MHSDFFTPSGQWWRPTRQGIASRRLIQTMSRGRLTRGSAPPSDGKISPCLKKLILQVAAKRHPRCSALSVSNVTRRLDSVWVAAQLRKPVDVRFAFAKPVLGAAVCVAAHRSEERRVGKESRS